MNLDQFFPERRDRGAGQRPFDKQQFPTHGGVYAFADAAGSVIRLSSAENLRRAIAFRLYPPADESVRPQINLLAVTDCVCWAPTHSQFETYLRYHEIAYRLYPNRHRKLCAFGPCWFATVDMDEQFPRWQTSSDPFADPSVCVGPLPTRRKCEQLVNDLQDLFSLCRYHHILQQTPHGEACAYFEMGRCPAPCDGTIPFSQYREMLDESIRFALGDARSLRSRLQAQMRSAAVGLAYEAANRAKLDLDRAESVAHLLHRVHRRIADFRYVIIQRAGGRTKVKAFLVNHSDIQVTEPSRLDELNDTVPRWLERFARQAPPAVSDRTFAAERIWLVSHFLHKRERIPGLYLHDSDLPDALTLAEQIRRSFSPKRKTGPAPA